MAIDDLYFRLRIAEELKERIAAAARANDRSMTAEIIARLTASFSVDDVDPNDRELVDIVADFDRLRRRVIQSRKTKR
ncbi:Arc family DNA-binding protein [Rhizobium sp. BK060]|uniref:Arc family DNA-binding protein n=1 Tax=Rhizobium sp. BK060 TaxID=2587096 RepID=UPI00161F965F|nr:Arc family DNA-binding protein [Rhizobium sp. BK060]